MRDREYEHLHEHLRRIDERLETFGSAIRELARLEIATSLKELTAMAKQSEEINKLSDKFDSLGGVVTDIHADFEALRAVLEADRENLSDAGVAALDAANAKADALAEKLRELDVQVGDADGSDIPTPAPGDGGDTDPDTEAPVDETPVDESPVDEAPPAGEGTIVAPDAPFDVTDDGARPTA